MTIPSTEDRVQFNVQNVYEYCRRHAKEQGWNDLRSFQVAMPSFPKCELSFDFAAPSGEQCPLRVTTTVLSRGEVKDFFGSSPVSDGGFVIKGAYQGKDRVIDRSPERSAELLAKGREFVADPAIGLFLGIAVYAYGRGWDGWRMLPGTLLLGLTKDGAVHVNRPDVSYLLFLPSVASKIYNQDELVGAHHVISESTMVALATFSFANCRNVDVLDQAPSWQQRRFAERHGTPLAPIIKTLVLRPLIKRGGRTYAASGGELALHMGCI